MNRDRFHFRRARLPALVLSASLGLFAGAADARDATRLINVTEALQAIHAHDLAGDLVLRFGRASEAGADIVSRDMVSDGEGNRATDVNKTGFPLAGDDQICNQAFESALTKLVIDARKAGARAVVGIVSDYKGSVMDDAYHVECHAGTFKAYVTLKAQFARSAEATIAPPPVVNAPLVPDVGSSPPTPLPPAQQPPTFQPVPQK